MESIPKRLSALDFFSDVDPKTCEAIAKAGAWFSLAGGSVLYEQGSASENVYFVLNGRLVVAREGPEGENIVGYIGAGEPVGEMSLILDENHTATVFALRDTELIAIPHTEFDRLHEQYGDLAAALSRAILRRSRQNRHTIRQSSPKVFALIGTSPSIDIDRQAKKLSDKVSELGLRALTINEREDAPDSLEFDDNETKHDIVILSTRVGDSAWYRFVLRHADRFFVFARRDAIPPKPFPLSPEKHSPARRFRLVDLIMMDEGVRSCSILDWQDAVSAQRIFHWNNSEDVKRLARIVAGKSVGIVLSGGGARAYAHIGAVRAIREKGIPIDLACGASMGGIVAACIAIGWSDDEVDYRVKQAFVESNPLSDFRLPVVALTRGKIVEARLKEHFGDALIEETQIPYFCVSADLASGSAHVHRQGLVRDALRASISLPGILPPIVHDNANALLVDGGLINNFPTDIMSSTHRGVNIGIDVARKGSIDPRDYLDTPGFFRWIREYGIKAPPPIIGLLMRSATTRRESTMLHHPADIMITPAVQGVDLRAWKEYDLAVEEGYKATIEALEAHEETLSLIS